MAYLLKDLSLKKLVTQAAHGFVAGDVLYDNNGTFAKAKADAIGTSYVAGIVESAATDTFMLVSGGPVTLSGLTPVSQYYLSAATAGAITTTKPSGSGQFVVPILVSGTATDAQVFVGAPTDAAFGGLLVSTLTATQGTITAAAPNISGSVTWNNGAVLFTGWSLAVTDTASDVESKLIDMSVGGTSKFSVRKDGAITSGVDRPASFNGAYLQHNSSDTNTQPHLVSMVHATSATPAALFGGILRFRFTTTDTTVQTAASFVAFWTDPTTATRTSSMQVQTINAGAGSLCGTFTQGQLQFRAGTAALPSISYDGNPDCGLYFPTVNSIGVSINATLLATWDAAAYTLTGPRLVITHGTLTSNLPSIDNTVTWNNSGVTFEAWKLSVTATAQGGGSRYISILKDGNDHAVLDNLSRWHVFRQTADTSGGFMTLFKRGTTGDATAAIAADTTMGFFSARGWNGSAYHTDGSGMQIFSDELFTGTNGGTRIELRVVAPGSSSNGAYFKLQSGALTLQSGCRLVITRGTLTANAPSISITETWNAGGVAFTGIQSNITNTASAATSNIIDLQVDGISKFTQDLTGRTYIQRQVADGAPLILELRKRGNGSGINNSPASGDNVARIDFRGWDGTSAYVAGGTVQVQAAEAWSSSASGGRLFLAATPTGSTSSVTYVQISNISSDPSVILLNSARLVLTRGTLTVATASIDETVTWNNGAVAFTGWKLNVTNTASLTTSLLLNLQVDSITRFQVSRTGGLTLLRQEADTSAASITLNKRGTTGDATAAVVSGDAISGLDSGAYDGTTTGTVALLRVFALENFTNTAHGCQMLFGVPAVGGTTVSTRMALSAASLTLQNGCALTITHGTLTTNLNTLSGTVTWNNAGVTFTGLSYTVTDTASNAASLLINLVTGSVSAFKVRKDGLTTIGSPTAAGSAPTTAQVRLAVGNVASPNVLQINGNSTADNVPVLSIFRSGNREALFAIVGTTLYISNTGGVGSHTDTNCSTAPYLAIASTGTVQTVTGTITSGAVNNISSTVTWNAAATFAGWKLNVTDTSSNTDSLLIDLQVGGSSRWAVDKNGNILFRGSGVPTSLVGGVAMPNGTAASANPTNAIVFWAASGEWQYRTSNSNEGGGQTNRVHNRASQVTGSGTNYTLTNTTARIDFGTTDAEVTLPTEGTYLVIACVSFIGDAAGAGDEVRAKLRNSSDSTDVGVEKKVTIATNSGREIIILDEIVVVTASKTIQIFGHNNTAARGSVESTTTTIKYVRLS